MGAVQRQFLVYSQCASYLWVSGWHRCRACPCPCVCFCFCFYPCTCFRHSLCICLRLCSHGAIARWYLLHASVPRDENMPKERQAVEKSLRERGTHRSRELHQSCCFRDKPSVDRLLLLVHCHDIAI